MNRWRNFRPQSGKKVIPIALRIIDERQISALLIIHTDVDFCDDALSVETGYPGFLMLILGEKQLLFVAAINLSHEVRPCQINKSASVLISLRL